MVWSLEHFGSLSFRSGSESIIPHFLQFSSVTLDIWVSILCDKLITTASLNILDLAEDLPDPGIEPESPALAGGFFTTEPPGKPKLRGTHG